jgi:diguanylate cyclase (GGDEF)-like protein
MAVVSKNKIFGFKALAFCLTLRFKALAFCLTLLLLVFYEHFPQRTLELYPERPVFIYSSVDAELGGNSQLRWLDKKNLHWVCELKQGALFPYCGISVAWSNEPFQMIDFSKFDHLEVKVQYQGQAQYLRVFVRNFYPAENMQDTVAAAKFNSRLTSAADFSQAVQIPLDELRVADWWIDRFKVPPQDVKPDVSKAIAIGIDMPFASNFGEHEFKLESFRVVGSYISKESWYLGTIILWAILVIADMLLAYFKLRKQISLDEQQLLELKAKSAIYQEKAEHDKLTGVLNREGLNRIVEDLSSTQLLHQYTLMVLDLDNFKQVNDQHGHAIGDCVLQETAAALKKCIRSYDMLSRWGGEEFVILFHCLDYENILPFAEKLRTLIESTPFVGGKLFEITISIGATNLNKAEPFESAFDRADKALYKAKAGGRNKTEVLL